MVVEQVKDNLLKEDTGLEVEDLRNTTFGGSKLLSDHRFVTLPTSWQKERTEDRLGGFP